MPGLEKISMDTTHFRGQKVKKSTYRNLFEFFLDSLLDFFNVH